MFWNIFFVLKFVIFVFISSGFLPALCWPHLLQFEMSVSSIFGPSTKTTNNTIWSKIAVRTLEKMFVLELSFGAIQIIRDTLGGGVTKV